MQIRSLFVVAMVLGSITGCESKAVRACKQGLQGSLLGAALDASDQRGFNEALRSHGSIQSFELPCISAAATSSLAKKRRFAATLMVIVRDDDPKPRRDALVHVATETRDPVVWATAARALLDGPKSDDAGKAIGRTDMIEAALRFTDKDDAKSEVDVQATGLRAGLRAHAPGMDAELTRRLGAKDDTLVVALDALSVDEATTQLPRLLDILTRYEGGESFASPDQCFVALIRALVRSGDPKAIGAARTALAKDYTNPNSIHGSRREMMPFTNDVALFHPEPQMLTFLLALVREGHTLAPMAFDILSTQVWANHVPPSVELVTTCVALLEPGYDSDSESMRFYNQLRCERLLYFVATGKNPIDAPEKIEMKDELARARQWLDACKNKKDCAP